jgi:hypothetical protein
MTSSDICIANITWIRKSPRVSDCTHLGPEFQQMDSGLSCACPGTLPIALDLTSGRIILHRASDSHTHHGRLPSRKNDA